MGNERINKMKCPYSNYECIYPNETGKNKILECVACEYYPDEPDDIAVPQKMRKNDKRED